MKEFKKGDKVFDILNGWGEVIDDCMSGIYPLVVDFNGERRTYCKDGRALKQHLIPLLYHEKPSWCPKRRIEHKGWMWVSNQKGDKGNFTSPYIYDSKELADELGWDLGLYTLQQITYYTEE